MSTPALAHLERLRLAELRQALAHLPPRARVLELGAGTGWQARELAARGFAVEALDVPESLYAAARVFPVLEYDGRHLPYPAGSFDAVFSSNVLEHVAHLEELLAELVRVLVPGGRAVHVLPTPAWRLWTSLAQGPHVLRLVWRRATRARASAPNSPATGAAPAARRGARLALLFPERHGERGGAWSELYLFSARAWRPLFERAGFRLLRCEPNGLFYTGHALLGARLALGARGILARGLGSACRIWVLEVVRAP
ncbi:MAG: class I SAM-dependent methyltransferase [Planctomycetes bacterium]|nr:class I SAM-dependent methyltransferase [Planctomycetota bacterium]